MDNRKYYGLSTRAQHVLFAHGLMRDTERETRDAVREKIRTGAILGYRQCGFKTVRELEAWLDSPCAETDTVRCSTCAYMCGSRCHRFPPEHVSTGNYESVHNWHQPLVSTLNDSWCGEWKRKQ